MLCPRARNAQDHQVLPRALDPASNTGPTNTWISDFRPRNHEAIQVCGTC